MASRVRELEEQIYDLLTSSNLTYAEIGDKLGCSASTVSNKARNIVDKYDLNPSILRTSKRKKHYAKYCGNIQCHKILYVTAIDIKRQTPFHCSPQCVARANKIRLVPKDRIVRLYKGKTFIDVAGELGLSLGELARLFEHYNIPPDGFPENLIVTPAHVVQGQTQKIKPRRSSYGSTRSGFRDHLGFTVRSSWENNFCLYLNHMKIPYEYEPQTFYFPEKTGARGYLPDFKMQIDGKEVWCEVKGRMDSKDSTKMKRLEKHFPEVFEKMTYIVAKPGCPADIRYKKLGLKPFLYYNDLSQEFSHLLKYWEK